MFMKAFLVALIAGICKIDNRIFGMTMIQRPLIVGTLVGFIYGNPVEGMIIGRSLNCSVWDWWESAHIPVCRKSLWEAHYVLVLFWERNRNRGSAGAGTSDFYFRNNHRIPDMDSVKPSAQ